MEENYLQYIKQFLADVPEMKPLPTLLKPFVKKDTLIRAVFFDVYGTLLISASGDIDESVISTENLKSAFDAAGITLAENNDDPRQVLSEILEEFKQGIRNFHNIRRTEDLPFPEVDILKVWGEILAGNQQRKRIFLNGPPCISCFVFVFEVLSNRIYPMPGMKEVINHLAGNGYPLGIISNAQFYTPVILNFFLHDIIEETEVVAPFDPDLTVFSYKHLRSKPDSLLFDLPKKLCIQKFGIYPDEVLFVGNDMFRDVYPARQAGFKTALFAGDAKSLRLRQDKPELKKIVPDYIITDLRQLLNIME
jgi:putative hydrolase of the HAD superfamily